MKSIPTGWTWVVSISRIAFLLLLVSCAQVPVSSNWESPLYHDHPLVGKIWSSATRSFVEETQLWQSLRGADFVFLGEKHDNPDHHQMQLAVLQQLIDENRVSHVTFEMLDSSADEALAGLGGENFSSLDELSRFIAWDEEGWDWTFYGPLINAAYRGEVPVRSGNITGETVGRVYGEPTPPEIATVLDDAVMEKLFEDIDASHCGLLPQSQFPAMVRVQQTRDYRMATQLGKPVPDKVGVLIAGNFHVRHDLGVPNYLLVQNAELRREDIVSLAFLEVQPGETDPAVYLEQFSALPAYDYIWFTPAVTAEDYCDSLR